MAKLYTQPQSGPASIDWSNPITEGLCFAVIGSLGAVDLVSGKLSSTWNGKRALKRQGVGLNATGAGTGKTAEWAFSPIGDGTLGVTLLSMSNPFAEAREGALIGVMMNGSPYKQLALYANMDGITGVAVSGGLTIESYSGLNKGTANSSVSVDGAMHVYAGTYLSGSPCRLYIDGVNTTGTTNGNADALGFGVDPSSRISIGNESYNTAGRIANAAIPLSLAWNRALTASEIAEVSARPWHLFKGVKAPLWVVASGGGATVIPIGVSASGSVGTPTATGAALATPAGVSATAEIGAPIATGGTSIPATVTPAGVSVTASVGTPVATGAAIATPSGVQASSAVGAPAAFGGTSIPATVLPAGVAALSYIGAVTATGAAQAYPAGVQAIGSVGTMIATGASLCSPGGVQAVSYFGTPVARAGIIEVYIPGAMAGRRMAADSTRPARIQTGSRPAR